MQIDCLSELEAALSLFTEKLASSIGNIQRQAAQLDTQAKAKLVSSLGGDIAAAHRHVIATIDKIPLDILGLSRKELETEIHDLQLQYQSALQKLLVVHEAARTAHSAFEAAIDRIAEDN